MPDRPLPLVDPRPAPADGPVVLVTDELPRPGLAGHLAVNDAVLSYLGSLGQEVVVLLAAARLATPALRLPPALRRARVEGPGLRRAGEWLLAPSRQGLVAAARGAVMALPGPLREALRRRARGDRYGDAQVMLGSFTPPEAVAWAGARIAALRPRAVLVDTIFRAPVLRHPALAATRSILLTHDVFHRRHASLRARGLGVFPPTLDEAEERALLSLADVVAAIQPEEEEALRRMLPGRRVILAGMPAVPRPRPPALAREPGRFVFLGSDSAHNVDGLRWFLAEAWPGLRARLPGATLEICGTAGRALENLPDGVTRRGVVEDLAPVLHRAACAVAPVLAGSGLKIKMLDYLAHGLPVAATPLAAAGLPLEPGVPVAVAEAPDALAEAAARLGGQPDPAAEDAALAWLARHYAPARSLGQLAEAIEGP